MSVVAIGDIGVVNEMIHIGDEAMFEALVIELRARGINDVTAISANPAESADRYRVDAIAPIGFPIVRGGDRASSEARMHAVVSTASGSRGLISDDDPAHLVIDSIRSADGLAIAGGGNMSSLWPMHVFERATLGAITRELAKPVVVSGQTIGPYLDDADSALVAELLMGARLVSVREAGSLSKCLSLGLPHDRIRLNVDDASFLVADAAHPEPYCAVTLASHVGALDKQLFIEQAAVFLDEVVRVTGLRIRFAAHFTSTDPQLIRGDAAMHDHVAARMVSPHETAVTTDARASARLARSASLVVSSRYHPVVFAVPNGVPAIAISVDDYTHVKLTGALANHSQDSVLAGDDLLAGRGGDLLRRVWDSRANIRDSSCDSARLARRHSARWWDDVAAAVTHG